MSRALGLALCPPDSHAAHRPPCVPDCPAQWGTPSTYRTIICLPWPPVASGITTSLPSATGVFPLLPPTGPLRHLCALALRSFFPLSMSQPPGPLSPAPLTSLALSTPTFILLTSGPLASFGPIRVPTLGRSGSVSIASSWLRSRASSTPGPFSRSAMADTGDSTCPNLRHGCRATRSNLPTCGSPPRPMPAPRASWAGETYSRCCTALASRPQSGGGAPIAAVIGDVPPASSAWTTS